MYDDEEDKLINEEKDLMNEMNEIGAKYRNVDIVYDRVIFNLKKILTKYENNISSKQVADKKDKDDKESKSFEENTSDNEEKEKEKQKHQEKDNENTKNKNAVLTKYEKILEVNYQRIFKFLEGNSKKTFENIVRDKFKIVEVKSKTENKQVVKLEGSLTKQPIVSGKLVEYDYEDRDVKDEDRQINEHVQVLNRIYWNEVRKYFYQ
jgi:G3E family GTPase